jgi:hypothetical protein
MNQDNPTRTLDQLWAMYDADPYASHRPFTEAMQATDWDAQDVDFFRQAVKLAFFINQLSLLHELVERGHQRFPDDDFLAHMQDVLTVKPARISKIPPDPNQALSQEWMKRNSHRYKGSWIAVLDGELLGTATTLKELMVSVRAQTDSPHVWVRQVL